MSLKKSRGFVGPIGDDIPSIFPIVAGVLLFIGTLSYVNNLVAEKNDLLDVRKAAISLSYVVTEKGSLDREEFNSICNAKLKPLAESNRVNFIVTLKRFCSSMPINPTAVQDIYYLATSDVTPSTYAFCTQAILTPSAIPTTFPQPEDAVVYSYPIAVPCPSVDSPTNGIGQVNVITWRGK